MIIFRALVTAITLIPCSLFTCGGTTSPPPYVPEDYEHTFFILRTTDAGDTWARQTLTGVDTISAICHVGTSTFIMGGTKGNLWVSHDSGATWKHTSAGHTSAGGVVYDVNSVCSTGQPNEAAMWTSDGYSSISNNAGDSWHTVTSTRCATYPVHSMSFSSPFGFVTGGGIFNGAPGGSAAMTSDGGVTWNNLPLSFGWKGVDIDFTYGGSTVLLVDEWGRLLRSRDLGVSWDRFTLNSHNYRMTSLQIEDDGQTVNATDITGYMYHSTDLFDNWTATQPEPNRALYDITGVNGTLWAVGETGLLISSSNKGDTWDRHYAGTLSHLWKVSFLNDSVGVIVGLY
jgi:photosystem II stability/assembly factor-like uncharacterized protein